MITLYLFRNYKRFANGELCSETHPGAEGNFDFTKPQPNAGMRVALPDSSVPSRGSSGRCSATSI